MSCAKKPRLNWPQSPVSSAPSIYIYIYDHKISPKIFSVQEILELLWCAAEHHWRNRLFGAIASRHRCLAYFDMFSRSTSTTWVSCDWKEAIEIGFPFLLASFVSSFVKRYVTHVWNTKHVLLLQVHNKNPWLLTATVAWIIISSKIRSLHNLGKNAK